MSLLDKFLRKPQFSEDRFNNIHTDTSVLNRKDLDGYIIYHEKIEPPVDDIIELLKALEPITYMFKINKGSLIFADTIVSDNSMIVTGKSVGNKWEPVNQEIVVKTSDYHVIVHELGHVIDRYSDGENSLPWSRRPEFDFPMAKYREVLYKNKSLEDESLENEIFNVPELYYYSEDAEIFARLFEEYLAHEHSELKITQKPNPKPIDHVSKHVYEQNPEIKAYFDTITKNLHINRLGLWKTPESLQPEDLPSNKEKEVLY